MDEAMGARLFKEPRIRMKPHTAWITRKYNLGNYQTIDYHVEGSLDDGEDPVKALGLLENIITHYWESRTDKLVSIAKKE